MTKIIIMTIMNTSYGPFRHANKILCVYFTGAYYTYIVILHRYAIVCVCNIHHVIRSGRLRGTMQLYITLIVERNTIDSHHQSIQNVCTVLSRRSIVLYNTFNIIITYSGYSFFSTSSKMLSKVQCQTICSFEIHFVRLFNFYLIFSSSKVIVGSCVLLYISFTVQSYPQSYGGGGGGHDDDDHVDYYVSIAIIL